MLRANLLVCLLASSLALSCAGAGDNPLAPEVDTETPRDTIAQPDHASITLWGLWHVSIDRETGEATIIPLREAQFMANVTMFLQPPAGSLSFFKVENVEIDFITTPGYIGVECDVGLTHPFPGLDQYTGFDVRGVFMHNGELTSAEDSDLTYAGEASARLMNADGYTRWMNATEFTTPGILGYTPGAAGDQSFTPDATLNPYKYYCDGLGQDQSPADFFADPDSLSDRGCYRPGSTNFRHYEMLWPDGSIEFQYAVIASYENPDPNPPGSIPEDFPISANCPEAFLITVSDEGSTAYYESPSSKGGDLHLAVEIYDWGVLEHGVGLAGEVGSITLESPGSLIPSPVAFDPLTAPSDPGSTVSSVYHLDILNVEPSGLTGQTVLCRVTSAIHDTYDFGFGSDYPEDAVLAAYLVFDAPILPEGGDLPVAVAETCDCLWIAPGESITFDGTDSTTPNPPIASYEWDFDGDGTFGDSHAGPPETPTATYPNPGDFFVDLKVTDSAGKTDTLDVSEQLHVHVGSWTPPTAVSEIIPTIGFIDFAGDFNGSGSMGTIGLYEWDFEGDCIWDYQHPTIGDTTHAYDLPGDYDAILRVTSQGCDSVSTLVRMIEPYGILENGNFWDGTFPPWVHGHWNKPGPLVEEIISDPIFKNIVRFYSGPTSDGNCTWIDQDLDFDVSGLASLYFNFFLNVEFDTLYGDGWLGGDPDMQVRIRYEEAGGGGPWEVWYGYDTTFDGTWQWDLDMPPPWNLPAYVVYHEQEIVAVQQWHEKKTIDLMTLDPQPAKITWVRICSRGWSFESFTTLPWFSTE